MTTMKPYRNMNRIHAIRFILLIGFVSLFADMTYEGARSITGPFLGSLGASATVVGIVAGAGELIGYGIRLISGYLSDRTGKYWMIAIPGYFVNLLAVPLLALAGRWEIAAILMISERLGKAVRNPARDTMLSHATKEVGRGWGFGLHEALDQIGAVIGPLIVTAVVFSGGSYRTSFAVLLIPAIIALLVLITARAQYPNPRDMEPTVSDENQKDGIPRAFWFYIVAVGLIAAGFADYPLIAYHFAKTSSVSRNWIPIFYAVAMGVDALAALIFGYFFDRIGTAILLWATLISILFAPLVFFGDFNIALIGVAFWGVGMGAQESVMRAVVAELIPSNHRGTAYGIFNTGYGLFWFAGSALMGWLYDISIVNLVIFSVIVQICSLPLLIIAMRARGFLKNKHVLGK